jgi:peptidoglycan/LPS O-acetylase OafA/YrhL
VVRHGVEQGSALTASPGAGRARRADIQGLRGVAVLLVVLYHAGLHVSGGFTGVDVFFAISGFVITGMLLPELEAGASIDLRRFYARRARRLLPALAVMLTVVAVVGVLASPIELERTGAFTGIAASVFAANVYLFHLSAGYFDAAATLNPLLHTWTLAVEEQFYIVFPALLLIGWRLSRRRSRVATAAVVGAVSVLSFALAVSLSSGAGTFGSAQRFAFYSSFTRAWEFGAGALLALAAPVLRRLSATFGQIVGAAGLAAVVASAFVIRGTVSFPGWPTLLPVGGACALLVAGLAHSVLSTRILSARPIVWIGDRSYSWYLWHWPVIVFARALVPGTGVAAAAAALSLVPACLSYRYVENPIRLRVDFQRRRVLGLAAICVAVPIAVCTGWIGVQNALSRTSAMQAWQTADQPHADLVDGCESTVPLGQRTGPRWSRCSRSTAHARGRVVLVGDSNAGHFTEPVVRAAAQAGYDVTVAPLAGCPFVDLRVVGTSVGERACRGFDTSSLGALVRAAPSLVVLANRDDDLIGASSKGFGSADGGAVAYGRAAKARLWEHGLANVLQRLSRAGIPVLLVRPVPAIPTLPSGCAVIRVLTGSCRGSVARTAVAASLRLTVDAENRAVRLASTAVILDLENDLCGPTRCSSVRDGTVLYRDSDHLTVAGALTLTSVFYRAIVLHARARPVR